MVSAYSLVTMMAAIISMSVAQSLTENDYYSRTSRRSLTDDDYYYTTSQSSASTSAFWTYTARFVDQVSESPYTYYDGSVTTDTVTRLGTIKDGVTPTATPYSIYTSSGVYYRNLQIVEAYYETGAVASSDIKPTRTYDSDSTGTASTPLATYTSIFFSMPVTMTAPTSCPTVFTITTTASVDVPSQVTAQVTPTSVERSSSSKTYGHTVYIYETWYLAANAAPFTSTNDRIYTNYITSCSTPPAAYHTGFPRSHSSDSSYSGCSSFYYCHTPFRTWLIVIATVLPSLFLLGFVESFFWFRRLMCGKSALRCGTISWVFFSLLVLCFTRIQDRRSRADQVLLRERWGNMGKGARLRAWWRWGFRFRYPEELLGQFCRTTVGVVAPGQPLHLAMAQGVAVPRQVHYHGPPSNGGWVPPQDYVYPSPRQAGYYGDASKDGAVVSQYPVSMPQKQQMGNVSPVSPQVPQSIHSPQNIAPTTTTTGVPPQETAPTPPQPTAQTAPQIPPIRINNSPVANVPRETSPSSSAPPPAKNDAQNRDLYE